MSYGHTITLDLPLSGRHRQGQGRLRSPGVRHPDRDRLAGHPQAEARPRQRALCDPWDLQPRAGPPGPPDRAGDRAAVALQRGRAPPGRYSDAVGRALFSATAEFTLGVGWMAYDAGKHGLAQRYMAQALRISHAADDRAFGGRILAAMSHQALHLGDERHGLDFACAARAGTQGAVTPTTAAMLAAMEACAHAARGDTSPCLRALSDAERAFDRSTPAEDPPWVDFDEGGLAGHLARCFR